MWGNPYFAVTDLFILSSTFDVQILRPLFQRIILKKLEGMAQN